MSLLLEITGFFEMVARSALRRARGDGRLFVVVYMTVSLPTVFTSNDLVILTISRSSCPSLGWLS